VGASGRPWPSGYALLGVVPQSLAPQYLDATQLRGESVRGEQAGRSPVAEVVGLEPLRTVPLSDQHRC
jgi:hypothetical protein